ncbi:MAG: heptose-I-phosphate ethanolaminephosphotransferase [Burkholderiaceae bacterium]|jgi:heptose-I-phosphate ethanolaminephosphotransferase
MFRSLDLLNTDEFAKISLLMTGFSLGLTGLLMIGQARRIWMSRITWLLYLLFFLDASIRGFLRDYFGLSPNPSLVLQAALGTNGTETREFLLHNWRDLTQAVVVFGLVFASAVAAERALARSERKMPVKPTSRATHITVATMLILLIGMHFNSTMASENPLLVWPLRYQSYQQQLTQVAVMQQQVSRDMTPSADWKVRYTGPSRNTVVWVIGESINRANLSLYGYSRQTTPALDALRDELVVFQDVVSPEATTMGSLMHMLTPADLDQPHTWSKKPNVLMLAEQAGYKTYWISNHVPEDGWLGLVSGQADQRTFINKGAGRGDNNLDGNLLPHVAQALAEDAPKKLIVVHLLGAHPSYGRRYPPSFSRFDQQEDAVSASLEQAGRPFWIRRARNKYDNAVFYGDHVLAGVIELTAQGTLGGPASLLFSSDHGQEVGHNRDHAGHSAADNSGYEIPMLVWKQPSGRPTAPRKMMLENRPYQTDHLDHTMLGLLNINTLHYNPARDVMSEWFTPDPRSINGQPYLSALPGQIE